MFALAPDVMLWVLAFISVRGASYHPHRGHWRNWITLRSPKPAIPGSSPGCPASRRRIPPGAPGAVWQHRPVQSSVEHVEVAVALSRWRPSPARLVKLLAGLWVFGIGEALLVASELGNSPWTVLAQGLARQTALGVGGATIVVSAVVLAAWFPLRQRPGLGTVLNAILIGIAIDATLAVLPEHFDLAVRWLFVATGIGLVAVGSGLYLTSHLGPGPRDGLMTGLHRRTGRSLRLVRVCLELSAVAVGFALGGTVGAGTVAFALLIGPAVQFTVHRLGGTDTHSL